ncbi:hypothetical protein E2C01_075332 [Portunus trituberculatus]|uniref:Uncharacterized protein n=1 Tax=Portunus trituberculatus TaxID=210409 RepID=A0A5B7IJU8_PORTR|nr:hypothetical protein [Portunus trituberculatus]
MRRQVQMSPVTAHAQMRNPYLTHDSFTSTCISELPGPRCTRPIGLFLMKIGGEKTTVAGWRFLNCFLYTKSRHIELIRFRFRKHLIH